eukprot:gene24098-28915_t
MTVQVVVMGVAGAGKSTVAVGLATSLGADFVDGDDLHPESNVAKMRSGTPLTDEDRVPWLDAIAAWLSERADAGRTGVVACSALRKDYRGRLRPDGLDVQFVHLAGDFETISARMRFRAGHFMPESLLISQFEALEPLTDDERGITLNVVSEPSTLVGEAERHSVSSTASPGPFDISGKVALVTGSSRGIGSALATGLAEAGAVVVLNSRNSDVLEAERRRIADATGATVHAYAFDVTDSAAVRDAATRIEAEVGPVEIVVNNTGVQHRAPLLEFGDDDFRRVMDTNLTSAFYVGREFARGMVERGHGKIVNICSVQSELGRAGIAPYAASKGGLKMLTRGMCADWAPFGLQINAIAPGYFDTELTSALVNDPEFTAWLAKRTPAGRWGRTEELIGSLLFLASPASDFVNGQILYVDGGMTAVV